MKRLITAILSIAIMLPMGVMAAVADSPKIGLPGPIESTEIQIQDLRVTYRFDQVNEPGKSVGAVPVQITAKLHNFGSTQTLEVGIPLVSGYNAAPEIASVYFNGQEQRVERRSGVMFDGILNEMDAAIVRLSLAKDADVIIDIRLQQPIQANILPLIFNTAGAWKDTIPTGTVEAITPFTPANWNLEMRRIESDALVSLTYADNSASYSFQNLEPSAVQDVYWHFANMEALEYFARGNERFQKTQGDAKSFEMMRSGLLDMIPCNGIRMPLVSWWNNMYDTITMGVVASAPEGQERLAKAMELWSDNWHVPNDIDKECSELKQRPDRYKSALSQMLMIPPAERSTIANEALKKHDAYMKELSAKLGDGSVADSTNDELANDENLSEDDRTMLGAWDNRFNNNIPSTGDSSDPTGKVDDNSSFVSSTLAKITNWFPDLSLGSQILLFIFLAVILVVIVTLIIFKWRDGEEIKPPSGYQPTSTTKQSISPSFVSGEAKKDTEKRPDFKPPIASREAPSYPPIPSQPRKPDSFGQNKSEDKSDKSKEQTIQKDTNSEKPKATAFQFSKPGAPAGPVLNNNNEVSKKPETKPADPPWIKKTPEQELIKPTAPPPKPTNNNFPWQKKSDEKKDNEQKPGPTVNI
ncbi:MAG: hypothetical protein P1P90_04995 [Patescibacteria group bacterium]|nr:hypothetical protein [Patescibacteria group bacterium]